MSAIFSRAQMPLSCLNNPIKMKNYYDFSVLEGKREFAVFGFVG